MDNRRRRTDILFLAVLASSAQDVINHKGYELLKVKGPFPLTVPIMAQFEKQFPNKAERQKELARVQMVVNRFLPANHRLWNAELRLWFACQIVLRLVATGWRPPKNEEQAEFVQRMYDLAQNINLKEPPKPEVITYVGNSAELLRSSRFDMFKPA